MVDPRRSFQLDRSPRSPWWLWGIALVLHLPLMALMMTRVWHHTTQGWRQHESTESAWPVEPLAARFTLPPPITRDATPSPRQVDPVASRPPVVEPDHPVTVPQENGADRIGGVLVGTVPVVRAPVGSPGGGVADTRPLVLAPQYGSGILWGHLPTPTVEELARQALGVSSGPRIDSATTVRLQRYIDSLTLEQQRFRPQPPRWTTSLGGQTVGLDAQWIHLGPIRIPTAILALLPIAMPGNPTQQEYTRKLDVMRQDLYIAAGRAQNYADFRAAVAQLRAEREAEQAFRDAQRRRPSGGNLQE